MKAKTALKHVARGIIGGLLLILIAAACIIFYIKFLKSDAPPAPKSTVPIAHKPVRLPVLKDGVIKLSVAHVVNPRLEKFSDAQIAMFLAALKASAKAQLGRDIEFGAVEPYTLDEYFKEVPASRQLWRNKAIVDFKTGKVDRPKLEKAYADTIARQTAPAKDWAEYAGREIGLDRLDTDPNEWKKRLTDTHLARLAQVAAIKAADGKPVIDASPYNEWMFWNSVGERPRTHDLIITNQLVASAEYSGVDIHSALRGGITAGTTDFATDAQFGMQVWWSTFPFTSADPVIVRMRGGESYSPDEAARIAGASAAHELGHLFFQYGHPFGDSSCLMSPTPMLRFKEYLARLDAGKCLAANHAAMKPGTVKVLKPHYAG